MKKNIVRAVVCMMVAIGPVACGGGGGGSANAPGNSAAALTADSFSVASTRTFTSSEFPSELSGHSIFMNESGAPSSVDACVNAKIGSYLFTKSTNSTYTLSVNDTDVKDCYQYSGVTTNVATASLVEDHVIAIDNAGNPVDLSTMSYNLAANIHILQGTTKVRMYISITGTGSAAGRTAEMESIGATHATTGFNDFCTNEGADNCRDEEVLHYQDNFSTLPDYDYIDKSVIDTHGLGIVHGAPYYSGGTMTFTLNNWNGIMTYNADAYSAPTYTATDGTNNVSGGYSYTGAPALKANKLFTDARASLSRIMWRVVR